MGKFNKRCSKTSCCTKTNFDESKKADKKIIGYTAELGNDIHSLMSSKRTDAFTMPFSEMMRYEPLPKCAEKITELTLLLANSFVTGNKPTDYPEFQTITAKTNKEWPNVGQLNLITGMEAIENYIDSFHCDPTLKFCINFLMQKVDSISSSFLYEVKWSTPTKEEPITLFTASMFFCLKKYDSMDNAAPIEVTYVYEYSHVILRPGEVKFKDGWLIDIMQQKSDFSKSNNFKIDETV